MTLRIQTPRVFVPLPVMDETGFYVYTHARPDGSVFYVGKGRGRRARDFSPSRRTLHHRNIVEKYGLDAILVIVIPCETEQEAFDLERETIAECRAKGVKLINLTDGGEGASMPATPARRAALDKGRANRIYAGPGMERFIKAGREALLKYVQTDRHKEHARALGKRMAAERMARPPRECECQWCGKKFMTKAERVYSCSSACQQRIRRAKERAERGPVPKKINSNNTTGVPGVYWNKRQEKWIANISVGGKLRHIGTFASMDEAIAARKAAEASL